MIRFCYAICALLLSHCDLFAQVTWEKVYPVPDAHEKCAVASPLAGQFIVVGAEGRIWRSIDDGVQWSTMPSPAAAKLNDIIFSTTSTGCIVGEGGVILRTEDAGETWELVPSTISANWSAVTAADSNTFIAVGSGGNIVRSEDGGRSWSSVAALGEVAITDIAFATETLGAAVGDDGLFAVTTDGGRSWTTQSFSHLTYGDLRVVEALDDSTMVVCSLIDYCAIALHPDNAQVHDLLWYEPAYDTYYQKSARSVDGSVWLVGYWMAWCQTPPTPRHGNLIECTPQEHPKRAMTFGLGPGNVFCPSLRDAAVSDEGTCVAVAEDGIILRGDTSWSSWTTSNPATADLHGLAIDGDGIIHAYGTSAVSLASFDGGTTWSQSTDSWVETLTFAGRTAGLKLSNYIGAYNWHLSRTPDGGNSWLPAFKGGAPRFLAADIHHSGFCLAIDANLNLFKSTNSGETWFECPSIASLPYIEASIVIADEQRAYVILDRREILETTDQGRTWTESRAPITGPRKCSFLDSGIGVAEEHGLWLTRNAGVTWQRVGSVPFSVRGIHLYDSLRILIVGDDGSAALSTDVGSSWETSASITTNDLFACRILDESHCVAVGVNGTVLYGTVSSPTSIGNAQDRTMDYRLHQNFPNPFNPSTTIEFSLPNRGNVRLAVLDHLGREIAVLTEREYLAGTHSCQFSGAELPSGVYMYRLSWNGNTVTRRMILLR